MNVWKIVIHPNPDIDAIAAAWALRKFGGEKFLGINSAEIAFHNGSLKKEPGMIFVDCGGQDFDHHPQEKFPEDCSLSLVIKHLGIEGDPCLEKISQMVLASDLKGGDQPFSLAQTVKDLNLTFFDEPGKVIAWGINALEAKYNSQLEFLFAEHGSQFEKIEVELPGNIVRCIYAAETNSRSFPMWARYKGASLVVQRNPETGLVQIFSNKSILGMNFVIEDILRAVRVEEVWTKKSSLFCDWERFASEGSIPEVPEWYYHKVGQMVLNGSLTNPQVPPTKIPWSKIKGLVKVALSPELPNPGCRSRGDICFPRCEYRDYGFWRCRKLRYELSQKKPKSSSPVPPAG